MTPTADIILFLFIMFAKFFIIPVNAQDSSSRTVMATVKISICGNEVVEGGEDCDRSDFVDGKTCVDLGYAGGDLKCDISCSFDTSNCISSTITLTPTAAPVSTSTSVSTTTSTSLPEAIITVASNYLPIPGEFSTTTLTALQPISESVIPSFIKIFDADGNGKIDQPELYNAVKQWVDEWKNYTSEENAVIAGETTGSRENRNCDINNDGLCDLKDFSVLMYLVENE